LVEAQPFNKLQVGEGIFEYIEKGKNGAYNHKVIIVPTDEQIVKNQMEHTYQKIKSFQFNEGCESKDCHWCNFVKSNKISLPAQRKE
jgi:DNA helicase-2/ATP-dependent DNA helicase PcrA